MNALAWIAVGLAAVLGFGPKLHTPAIFQKQPPTEQLQLAQAELEKAKASQAAAAAALAEAKAKQEQRTLEQIRYAQQTNDGVVEALQRVPSEHRTPEVKLAGNLAARTTVSLSAAVGALPPEQRAEILKIVDGALSQVEAERDAAQAALARKDAELQSTIQAKAELASEVPKLKAALDTKAAEVLARDAQVQTVSTQVRVYAEQKAAAEQRAGSLDAFAGSLMRWAIVAGVLYVLIHFVLPCVAQEFPGIGWLAKLNQTAKSVSSAHL